MLLLDRIKGCLRYLTTLSVTAYVDWTISLSTEILRRPGKT